MFALLRVIREKEEEEAKDEFAVQSFSAWQIIESLRMMFGEENTRTFQTHLEALGLWKREEPEPEDIEKLKEIAIRKAETILAMHFKGGANNGN